MLCLSCEEIVIESIVGEVPEGGKERHISTDKTSLWFHCATAPVHSLLREHVEGFVDLQVAQKVEGVEQLLIIFDLF